MWIILSILLSTACLSFADQCPPRENVYPCSCSEDQWLVSVNCEAFNGLSKLQPVLKNTQSYNVSFGFWRSNMGDIPSDFFKGHQSVNLHFENCKIGSFGEKPFEGLENSLKNIYIYGSVDKRRKDLKTFPLGHLKKLKDLSFQANDIVKLGDDWFKDGPESLEQLNLEANDIEELGSNAFASLINVQQIWLGDNRFKTVSRSMFPRPANKLWLLEMSFSGIEVLPSDMFEDFPVLRDVNFMGNNLKTLPETTWGRIWSQLDEVYLERNNKLICDENIKWVYSEKLPNRFTGKCTGNNKLSGKELKNLKLEDFE